MGAHKPPGGLLREAVIRFSSPAEQAAADEIAAVSRIEGGVLLHEFDCIDEHQKRLANELSDIQVFESHEGQLFSGLWLNRRTDKTDEKPLLIVENGFITDVTQTDAKFRAYFLARNFSDHEILVIDQPGHGLSSRYSAEQRKGLSKGDMSNVGQNQLSALESFARKNIGTITDIKMKSESLGARQGIEVAEASKSSNIPIKSIVALELPGTEDGRRVDIHASFFGYEFLRASYYDTDWHRLLLENTKENKGSFVRYLNEYGASLDQAAAKTFFLRDKRMAIENFWRSTLGYGTGLKTLRRLLDSGVEVVRVTGDRSRIDRLAAAEQQRRSMLEANQPTFAQIALRHESHDGTGTVSRARLSALLCRFAFDHSAELRSLNASYVASMRQVQSGVMPSPTETEL